MACEYRSVSQFQEFEDQETLKKALDRVGRQGFSMAGQTVIAENDRRMNELRQAYQTESTKAALKKKGFFVSEVKDGGKIKLTVSGGRF